mgnify:CR=1 FL=1
MAIGLVGQKLGMTRLLSDDGSASSVSVIKIEPNHVVQTKTIDSDGYNALQVTIGKKIKLHIRSKPFVVLPNNEASAKSRMYAIKKIQYS